MKFLLALLVSIALALVSSPLLFTEESPPAARNMTPEEQKAFNEPAFTLETRADDSQDTAKFKAALRLLNAYTVTANQLRSCAAASRDPAIAKTLNGYHGRNGTVMNNVMRLIKQHGGLTKEIRIQLDERARELITANPRRGNCPALVEYIDNGGEDLYKAERYAADYDAIRITRSR